MLKIVIWLFFSFLALVFLMPFCVHTQLIIHFFVGFAKQGNWCWRESISRLGCNSARETCRDLCASCEVDTRKISLWNVGSDNARAGKDSIPGRDWCCLRVVWLLRLQCAVGPGRKSWIYYKSVMKAVKFSEITNFTP